MRIVPAFDELKYGQACLCLRVEGIAVEQIAFECGEEALAESIVIAIADGSHRWTNPSFPTALAEGLQGVSRRKAPRTTQRKPGARPAPDLVQRKFTAEAPGRLWVMEAMRRRLIGDVSHELRTPLTAIKGSMEGLMDGVLPATQETFQQIILRHTL